MKPQEVAPEWAKARALLGDAGAAMEFVQAAMARFDAPLEATKSGFAAHLDALESRLRERLEERGLSGTVRLATSDPVPARATLLTRTHPLTSTLSEALVEGALDAEILPGLELGRRGAWPTPAVTTRTVVALLRLRLKLTVHARRERLLLAEEAALVAISGGKVVTTGVDARKLLATPAAHDLAAPARERTVRAAQQELPALMAGPLSDLARGRAAELLADHGRLRAAATGVSRVSVEPVLPADVIGLFVLLPSGA
jgi:hypothetical protein